MTIALTTPRTWVTGEVPTASILNAHLRDNSDYFTGETAWTAPTFQNAWVNFGFASTQWSLAGYRKIGDMVWLKGLVKSGTVGAAIFTLPVGYRPSADALFAVDSNNLFGVIDVTSAGVVKLTTGSNVYVQLDGLVFSTV
jgi:hypothetical protein